MIESTLEALLASTRLKSAFYFSVAAGAPWATLTPHMRNIGTLVMPNAQTVLPFHIMLDGEAWCWRADDPDQKRSFRTGDILLLPRGCDHIIASGREPDVVPEPDTDVYRKAEESRAPCTYVDLGGDGPKANFVCGYFGLPRQSFHPLLEALPDLMILSPSPDKWALLRQLVEIATRQQSDRETGGKLVVSRLAETMFVDAVHQHVLADESGHGTNWLAALQDRHVGAALKALHGAPQKAWTAEQLARQSGLSRSAFMERFARLVGLPPMQYLKNWRLQLEANLLAESDLPIKQVADHCGYGAETSFHRAFKQQTGMTPGAWRRLHQD
ncbi:MAG: AraC family transcriptional regulator [Pseudomonadota bacterium]